MSNPYYPKLDLGLIAGMLTVRQQMRQFEDYLSREDCPYDADTRGQLAKLLAPEVITKEKIIEVEKIIEIKEQRAEKAADGGKTGPKIKVKTSGVDQDGVSKEIQDLRKELQQLKVDSKGLQTADKIQIIKTRAGLVEKLVSMDERTNNLKKTSVFMSTVLGVLDDLIPEDRRLEFLRRIQPFAAEDTSN